MDVSLADKRKFKRIWFREPVEYLTDKGSNFGGCLGVDLSEGGLRFYFSDFIPPSTEMTLNFSIRQENRIGVNGRVAWVYKLPHSEQYLVGVEFSRDKDNLHSINQLQQYVESQFFTSTVSPKF